MADARHTLPEELAPAPLLAEQISTPGDAPAAQPAPITVVTEPTPMLVRWP